MKWFLTYFFSAVICFVLSINESHAQLEKGNYMLGGSARFGGGWVEDNQSAGITLNPSAGYFITKHIVIGTSFLNTYSFYNYKYYGYSLGAGPFAKILLFSNPGGPALFYQLDYSYIRAGSPYYTRTQIMTRLENKLGLIRFLSHSVSIEPCLYFALYANGTRLLGRQNNSEFGVSISIQVYLESKKNALKRMTDRLPEK